MTPTDLIARLQEATEGSRELDDDVWRVFNEQQQAAGKGWKYDLEFAPHYTTSIDAALSLVPEGADWIVSRMTDLSQMRIGYTGVIETLEGQGEIDRPFQMERKAHAVGGTPALALCIAALKARETKDK